MPTETQKRKQTLSVLDRLRAEGMPNTRYSDKWTGEELPPEEQERQENFEEQTQSREEQRLLNRANMNPVSAAAYGASSGGMRPGPTGMSSEGMVPLSPEEFERRRKFTRPASSKRKSPASSR